MHEAIVDLRRRDFVIRRDPAYRPPAIIINRRFRINHTGTDIARTAANYTDTYTGTMIQNTGFHSYLLKKERVEIQ